MQIQDFSLVLVGIIALIILYSFLGNFLEHKHFHYIHQTGVGIIIGFIFGIFLYYVVDQTDLEFNQEVFFYGLLPPMIFAGGYNLKKKDFGKNITVILMFAVVGTIINFGITFLLTYVISQSHLIYTIRDNTHIDSLDTSLIVKYSATISASDSVASLTLLKPSEFPKLFSVIFGQGLVNDAVAIILYKVVGGLFDELDKDMSAGQIIKKILGSFFGTVFISIAIGILTALLCCYIFRKCRFLVQYEVVQVAFTYIFGILSYVMAEFFNMSGVITVLISGIVLAHYNFYNLTIGGMHATTVIFQSISFLAQAIVFVYLGVSTVYYFLNQVISFSFLGLELAVCIISRSTAIFGLSFLCRRFMPKKWTINRQELGIVAVGGTIRGSVAFALILTIQANDTNGQQVSVIKSTTLGLVCFTTIVLGGLMPTVINCILGPDKGEQLHRTQILQKQLQDQDEELQQLDQAQKRLLPASSRKKVKKAKFFKYSDQNYWRPIFIYKYQQRKPLFKLYKKIMKYNNGPDYKGGIFHLLNEIQAQYPILQEYVRRVQQGQLDMSFRQSHLPAIVQEQEEGSQPHSKMVNQSKMI